MTTRQPKSRIWLADAPRVPLMSTPANVHRSRDRAAQVLLRFSHEGREELRKRANEAGMTMQQYADWKLLDMDPNQPVGGRAVGQRPLEGLSA